MKDKTIKQLNKIDEWEVELILEDHFNEGEGIFLLLSSKNSLLEDLEQEAKFYGINEKDRINKIIREFNNYYLNDEEDMLYLESDSCKCKIELV